ncbi:MAG: 3'-5' exonuclease [Gammaproteobacteria bacterium]|nr:3'-5' exonuclease [Gammaproteobacteria bacterium]
MNVFVFSIQTIPDIDGARRLFDLHGLSDEDVARAVFHKRRQQANTELLRHHLHKIVAISAVLVNDGNFKVWSLGDKQSTELDLLQRFYAGIDRYSPILVSWGGSSFDLPVTHYRSLLYPVKSAGYWGTGEADEKFRQNNYLSRCHSQHSDLKDVLSSYQQASSINLDEIATLCGFPGKMTLDDSKVWETWLAGDIEAIRNYNECDVLNTYLVYLNWQRNRAAIDQQQYLKLCQRVREQLLNLPADHLNEFEKNWIDL